MFNGRKNLSDEVLMERFQNGSTSAFTEIYRRYSKRLLHLMYRLLGNNEPLAQDLLHDLFEKLVEKPNQFDASRNFKAWIFTVAANACRKEYRHKPLLDIDEQSEEIEYDYRSVMDKLDHAHFGRALKKELQNLSYEHRCTFVLRFQEKLSVKEIGQVMDCPEGTVKSRIFHSTKILANRLAVFNPINT